MKNKFYALLSGVALLMCSMHVLQAQPGSLDPTFNGTGYVVTPVNTLDAAQKILVQPDEKVLLIGFSFDTNYVARTQVFRLLPDGTPDTDFGTNGVFTYELDYEADIYSAVLTSEGKIILVGSTTDYQTYRLLLIQLNADGTLDNTFGTNGVVTGHISLPTENTEDQAYDVSLDALGNILVCGSSDDLNYVPRPVVVRFTPSGVLDTTFGTDGVATIPVLTVGSNSFKGIVVQPDGKIVASGYFGNTELWYVMLVVRFETDGTLDPTFGDAGIVKYNYGNVDDEGEDLKLLPDGSILVAGITVTQSYNYSALLAKFTPSGQLDSTFGTNGTVKEDLANFDYAANLEAMSDGTIIMSGTSGVGPPNGFDLAVWKYNADGTRDNTFGSNGVVQHAIPSYYTMIYAMDVQADGKILIGGQARTTINQNYFFIARLENDVISAVKELSSVPAAFVYPNPANMYSTISLRISDAIQSNALIKLYGSDGRMVTSISAQQLQRTGTIVNFNLPTGIAPGIYQVAFEQPGTRIATNILINE